MAAIIIIIACDNIKMIIAIFCCDCISMCYNIHTRGEAHVPPGGAEGATLRERRAVGAPPLGADGARLAAHGVGRG